MFTNARRVYTSPTQKVYFIEKEGTLRAYTDDGTEICVPFTPSPGWIVWKVSEGGELCSKRILLA